MSKAEEKAEKAYPKATRDIDGIVVDIGHPQYMRDLYTEGYHQAEKDILFNNEKYHTVQVSILDELYDIKRKYEAEKDLALMWEDIKTIEDILLDVIAPMLTGNVKMTEQEKYQEVLKRFKSKKV